MYRKLASELGFPLDWSGAIYLFPRRWYAALYPLARRRARRNGEEHIRLLSPSEVFRLEPNAWPRQRGGILLPDSGVVAPDQVTIAGADNAVENGARIFLNTAVTGLDVEKGRITAIRTNRGRLRGRVVINVAGVWADRVAELAGDRFYTIHPRKGVMAVADRAVGDSQRRSLGTMWLREARHTKGGGVSRTVEGNLLLGPTADEVPDREDHATSCEELDAVLRRHLALNSQLRLDHIIAYFTGVRAATFEEDFVVEASCRVTNLIHVAGIQSPGLTAAPAIAEDVRDLVVAMLRREIPARSRPEFDPCRKPPPSLSRLTLEERHQLIRRHPAYGRIVCRCEEVSEGEVVAAIRSPLPATAVSAVKHRVRTGMGRCQGGFCTPSILKLIARETEIPAARVTWAGDDSPMLAGETGE
jgi:glycerol-3-phosphate dehydrogenase